MAHSMKYLQSDQLHDENIAAWCQKQSSNCINEVAYIAPWRNHINTIIPRYDNVIEKCGLWLCAGVRCRNTVQTDAESIARKARPQELRFIQFICIARLDVRWHSLRIRNMYHLSESVRKCSIRQAAHWLRLKNIMLLSISFATMQENLFDFLPGWRHFDAVHVRWAYANDSVACRVFDSNVGKWKSRW